METVIIIVILLIIGLPIFLIMKKINDFKYRASQQVMGSVGLGMADANAKINEIQENGAISKYLVAYPTSNEQAVKALIQQLAGYIINNQNNGAMSQQVLGIMNSDQMLVSMRNMNFVRANLLNFSPDNGKVSATAVYTDTRDEYQIMIFAVIQNGVWSIEKINVLRGMVKGF